MNYLHKFGFHVFQRRESSFSSSNERRSLLPAIKPTDTMVHCTPSNKNQSASFRILFFFWNFKFFFFFCIFPTSPRTIFIQWIKNRGNFSKFLRFVFACCISHTNLLFPCVSNSMDKKRLSTKLHMEFYGNLLFWKELRCKVRSIYFESNKCHFTTLFPIFLIEIDRPSSFFQLSWCTLR